MQTFPPLLVLWVFLDIGLAVFTQKRNICYWEQLDNKQPLISIEDPQRPNPSVPV